MNDRMKMIANIAFSIAREKRADLISLEIYQKQTKVGEISYVYGEASYDTIDGDIKMLIRNDGTFERI